MRITFLALAAVLAIVAGTARAEIDWNQLEEIFARPASEQPGGIRRFSFPRTDLDVTLDGVSIRSGLALGLLACLPAVARRQGHGHG